MTHPRVFISYSHDSDEHAKLVLNFANRLRGDGIDARIDQFTPDPPEGWDYWMERQIFEADRVIALVTPTWAQRFDGTELDDEAGKGVSHEARILRAQLYHSKGRLEKLCVVKLDGGMPTAEMPDLINTRTIHCYPSGYDTIRDSILGRAAQEMAPLGNPPVKSPQGFLAPTESIAPPADQPYNFTHPAVGDQFVGRVAELREIQSALENGNCVSIVGDTRIGKSSLLRRLYHLLKELNPADGFVRVLSGESRISESIASFVTEVTGRWPRSSNAHQTASNFEQWAKRESKLLGVPPIILIDEFESLVWKFDKEFWGRLRGMLQNGILRMVTVSRRSLIDLFKAADKTSPFGNTLQSVQLGLLAEAEAEELIRRGGFASPVRLAMRTWAGRHPAHLQAFGYYAHAHREETTEALVNHYWQNGRHLLEAVWNELDERDRDDLCAAANGTKINRRNLINRGLLSQEGQTFGEIVAEWLREHGKI